MKNELKFLFKNVAVFVTGFTKPTSVEIKGLMRTYGGLYCDYISDRVTHIICSNLAYSKANLLKKRLVVKPEWIVDSIANRKQLNTSA